MATEQVSLEGMSPADIANMAALNKLLSTNPDTAREYRKLVKKAVPELHVPELEIEDRLDAVTKDSQEKIDKLAQQLAERDARDRWNEIQRQAKQHGVTDEELSDGSFVQWAGEQGFTAVQLPKAAEYRNMMRQLATPTPTEAPSIGGFRSATMTKEDHDELRKNPNDFLEKQGNIALQEIRAARAAGRAVA